MLPSLKNIIRTLPLTSGVYLMKNAAGQVIYIGKAVSNTMAATMDANKL
jgi:excinuclease UvrABC nuclease subunit